MGSSAWVLALALGLVAVHTVSATNYTLGGSSGWTNTGNIDYTAELAAYTIKVGDTVIFMNNDAINHSVVVVPTQLAYDNCDYSHATAAFILPYDYYLPLELKLCRATHETCPLSTVQEFSVTFKKAFAHLYVICAYHCLSGQKVTFSIANADGSPAPGSAPTPSPTGSIAPTPSSTLAPPPPPLTLTPTPASTPAAAPAPSTSSTPPPPPTTVTASPSPTTTATPPPPPPGSSNVTTSNPFGIVRSDAAGIARFGWLTIAVVCALSCYNIL